MQSKTIQIQHKSNYKFYFNNNPNYIYNPSQNNKPGYNENLTCIIAYMFMIVFIICPVPCFIMFFCINDI